MRDHQDIDGIDHMGIVGNPAARLYHRRRRRDVSLSS